MLLLDGLLVRLIGSPLVYAILACGRFDLICGLLQGVSDRAGTLVGLRLRLLLLIAAMDIVREPASNLFVEVAILESLLDLPLGALFVQQIADGLLVDIQVAHRLSKRLLSLG